MPETRKPLEILLTPSEAAQLLGLKPGTLMIWRSTGRYNLPFVKLGGRVAYKLRDIQEFIERRTVRSGVERLAS